MAQRPYFITPGCVGCWRFDEGTGTLVRDSSGYRNDGAATGLSWVDGRIGKAGSFNGNSYVNCGANNELNITGYDISIEFWVKFTAWHINNTGFIDHNWGAANSYQIYQIGTAESTGILTFANPGAGMDMLTRISLNKWYHIVFVQNSTNKIIYLDGVQDAINSNPANLTGNNNPLMIGTGHNSANRINGTIDEVRIYNRALSAEEIKAHYNNFRQVII